MRAVIHHGAIVGFGLLILAAPTAAWPGTVKPTSGYEIVWRGSGDQFIEVSRKVGRSSIELTLKAHHFHHHRRDGMTAALAALDTVTAQLIEQSRQVQEVAGNRVAEVQRRDRPFGAVLTRTVELAILDEKALRAAAVDAQRKKDEAEKKEQEARRKKEESDRAERDRQEKRRQAEDRARRDREDQQRKEKAERERQEQQRAEEERAQRERQEAEARAEAQRAAAAAAAAPRPVPVRVVPAASSASFQSLQAFATDRQFIFDWKAAPGAWPAGAAGVPLTIAVFNREGTCVARYVTPDRFTGESRRVSYEVGETVVGQTAWMQVGFAAAP